MGNQTILDGLIEVEEIILLRNKVPLTIPANTAEASVTIPHNLGFAPFVDYKISFDNGLTYRPPPNVPDVDPNIWIQPMTDRTNLYFFYTYSLSPAVNSAYSAIIDYKLYTTEAR